MVRNPFWRESPLEERLEAVVLGRVHPDEHRLHELEREDAHGGGDAPALRRIGLPVSAYRVYVVRGGDGPVPGLPGILGDAVRPVHRTLSSQLPEKIMRRTVAPQLSLGDEGVIEIAAGRRHPGLPVSCAGAADHTGAARADRRSAIMPRS